MLARDYGRERNEIYYAIVSSLSAEDHVAEFLDSEGVEPDISSHASVPLK
jgi:hypothetical protein